MPQESAVDERVKHLENSMETLVETTKTIQGELGEIKTNLLLSSEILNKLIEFKSQDKNCYKSFGKFVEASLLGMERTDADKAVLEIVDVLFKYKKPEGKGESSIE